MKIAYLFHRDAANPTVQSGRPASILAELKRCGVDIEEVFPLQARPTALTLPKKVYYRLFKKLYRGDREPGYVAAAAREFTERTRGKDFDMVFSPGSEMVARVDSDRPIAFCADATFANMVDYYWDFTNLSAEYLRKGHALERASISRAALAIYPSRWAADSAINDYGADPEKVAVIPFGANFGKDNQRADVEAWIAARPRDELRLLFVGRHWDRKGGDLVVDTAYCLQTLGHRVIVDVVGCDIPVRHRGLPWLRAHGVLQPQVEHEARRLHALFATAHYVFVPSRAEAYGMTFAEANAFGVPAVSTSTGGIPAVITDGHNGHLLALDARGEDYADVIAASFANAVRYRKLCQRSYETFAQALNWKTFTRRFLELAAVRCHRPGRPHSRPVFARPATPLFTH